MKHKINSLISAFYHAWQIIIEFFIKLSWKSRILIVYSMFLNVFLFLHLSHLPLIYLLSILFVVNFVGLLFLFALILTFQSVLKRPTIIKTVLISIAVLIPVLISGLLQLNEFVILFALAIIFSIFSYLANNKKYILLIASGCSIFSVSILSFQTAYTMETYFYLQEFKRYIDYKKEIEIWEGNKNGGIVRNSFLNIELNIPEGFRLFEVQDLKYSDKIGIGQISAVISTGEVDPTLYPNIRFYFLPNTIPIDEASLVSDYDKIISISIQKNEIEITKEGVMHKNPELGWEGYFVEFFDSLRPRNGRTGFYKIELPEKGFLILHITENINKESFHDANINKILLQLSNSLHRKTNQ